MSNVHVCPDANCWHRRVAEAPTGAFDGMWPPPRIVGLPPDDEMADVRAWNELTARAERAEAAIREIGDLAYRFAAFDDRHEVIDLCGEIHRRSLAALDSTDPVEDAPMIDPTDENDFRSTYEAAMGSLRADGHLLETGDRPPTSENAATRNATSPAGGQLDAPAPTRSGEHDWYSPIGRRGKPMVQQLCRVCGIWSTLQSRHTPCEPDPPATAAELDWSVAGLPADGEERTDG